jgi:ribokinase
MEILIAGDLNADLVIAGLSDLPALGTERVGTDCDLAPGGSAANAAAGLAALGARARLLARVGDDLFGNYLLETMGAHGVDVSLVAIDAEHRTGITVALACATDRAFATYSGAVAQLSADDLTDADLRRADHLHIASIYLVPRLGAAVVDVLGRAKSCGCTTSLDTGFDPMEEWNTGTVRRALAHCDFFLPNETELRAIAGDDDVRRAATALASDGCCVVAKLGADGCLAADTDGTTERVAGLSVDARDTTGCGDAFNAAFLTRRLAGAAMDESLRFANAAGALCATRLGGTGSVRSAEEVAAFMKEPSSMGR